MTKLDKKIDNELRANKIKSRLGDVKDFFVDIAGSVSDLYLDGVSAVKDYIADKKHKQREQDLMAKMFESYIDMDDPSKVGTVEYKVLDNDLGIRVTVYTEHGPLIKTIYTKSINMGDFVESNADRYYWYKFAENCDDAKVAYEGYCVSSANSQKYDHYYYANILRTHDGAHKSRQYRGYVRSDNGKFTKVDTSFLDSWSEMAHFSELQDTFEKEYNNIVNKAMLQAE